MNPETIMDKNEETLQAIRALSNIEGYLIKNDGIPDIIGEHIDYIFKYLEKYLKFNNN